MAGLLIASCQSVSFPYVPEPGKKHMLGLTSLSPSMPPPSLLALVPRPLLWLSSSSPPRGCIHNFQFCSDLCKTLLENCSCPGLELAREKQLLGKRSQMLHLRGPARTPSNPRPEPTGRWRVSYFPTSVILYPSQVDFGCPHP